MEDKEVIEVLKGILQNHSLSSQEKEAILTSVGILAWTKLSEGRMRGIRRSIEEKKRTDI